MTTKGMEVMASGNLFHWEESLAAKRGGIRGRFNTAPSKADIVEAQRFCQARVPQGRVFQSAVIDATEQNVKSMVDQYVFGGQRN